MKCIHGFDILDSSQHCEKCASMGYIVGENGEEATAATYAPNPPDKMMTNVKLLPLVDVDPDIILQKAVGKLTEVVVVGYDKEGKFYFAGSQKDGPSVIWNLALAQKKLLDIVGDE